MAHTHDLRERILSVSKQLAYTNGISNINIRQVASQTGIALGTVYNYYPSKGDLIAAIVEDFWKGMFKGLDLQHLRQLGVVDGLESAYFSLLGYFNSFKTNLLAELTSLKSEDKKVSMEREREYLGRVLIFIEELLLSDERFSKGRTSAEIKKLSLFIYDNLLAMLRRGDRDFEFFKGILQNCTQKL